MKMEPPTSIQLPLIILYTQYAVTYTHTQIDSWNRILNMLDIVYPLVLSAQIKCATQCSGEHTSWAIEHKLSYCFSVYVLHCSAGTCTSIRANLIVGLMWAPPQGCRTQLYQLFQSIGNCALKHNGSTHLKSISLKL